MAAVASLKPGQGLCLIAPFEPKPLYAVLTQRGFRHAVETRSDGSYAVTFTPAGPADPAPPPPGGGLMPADPFEVDARGLEPPEPMVRILEALAVLPADSKLTAWTDRRPVHLLEQLTERGFRAETKPAEDGSFITVIEHLPA